MARGMFKKNNGFAAPDSATNPNKRAAATVVVKFMPKISAARVFFLADKSFKSIVGTPAVVVFAACAKDLSMILSIDLLANTMTTIRIVIVKMNPIAATLWPSNEYCIGARTAITPPPIDAARKEMMRPDGRASADDIWVTTAPFFINRWSILLQIQNGR